MSTESRTDYILNAALSMKSMFPDMPNENIKKEAIKRWNEYSNACKVKKNLMLQQLQPINHQVSLPLEIKPNPNIPETIYVEKKRRAYNNFVSIEVQKQKEQNKTNGVVEEHQQVLTSVSRRWKTLSTEDKDKYK